MFATKILKQTNRNIFQNTFFGLNYSTKTVGVIGLGNMGAHMATNLIKKGEYELVVFDTNPAAVEKLTKVGAKSANSPIDVAKQSQKIITMLPSSPHVEKVYTDKTEGILNVIQPGTLCIDCSTIDPTVSRLVAKKIGDKSAHFTDAPVSGGVLAAEGGTLTFMVGGSKEEFEKAKILLDFMGKSIIHCGDVGSGEIVKVCNNLVLGISMIGVSEAMNLGIKLGMNEKTLASVLSQSTARCWSVDTYNPVPGVNEGVPSSREYQGGFGSDLMKKDLGLAADAAKSANVPLALGPHAFNLYQNIHDEGRGGLDFSVAYDFLKNKSN